MKKKSANIFAISRNFPMLNGWIGRMPSKIKIINWDDVKFGNKKKLYTQQPRLQHFNKQKMW